MTDFGHDKHLVRHGDRVGIPGIQYIYRFDNGFGASVIQGFGSYGNDQGLWELALIKWGEEESWAVFAVDSKGKRTQVTKPMSRTEAMDKKDSTEFDGTDFYRDRDVQDIIAAQVDTDDNYDLVYSAAYTDVAGWLNDAEVNHHLDVIEAMDKDTLHGTKSDSFHEDAK